MKFLALDLLGSAGPIDEPHLSPADRFARVIDDAVAAEALGIDGVGIGEHHQPGFLSSAPTVVLGAIAARTSRIRLVSAVTVLSLLDPVRVAEDFATLDQLSRGRIDIIVGKGNTADQNALFGVDASDQWMRNAEKVGLLRRLLHGESVDWAGTTRPPLTDTTTQPRPIQQALRTWHGSAANLETMDLAARLGDPIFEGNIRGDLEHYRALVAHYRERWEAYGRDPADALVGSGTLGVHVARTSQQAVDEYRPVFESTAAKIRWAGGGPIFPTIEDALERGSLLVGSPQQVIDKIHRYHDALGHEVQALGDLSRVPRAAARASLELFVADVAPVLRRELPSRPWTAALDPADVVVATLDDLREPVGLRTH